MQVDRITSSEHLTALRGEWNLLTRGVPFRSWQWLHSWWRHYGAGHQLFVLAVRNDQGLLVGVAPWYVETCATRGRVLRFLGSGQVCSDYQTVLTTPEYEEEVTCEIGAWLNRAATIGPRANAWETLELSGVNATDSTVSRLVGELVGAGARVHRRAGPNCWRIALPATWDDYLASLSKSHRKQVRRVERRLLESDRTVLHTASDPNSLQRGMQVLVDLHQRRRQALGQPGCFACPNFSGFLHEAAGPLFASEQLQLHWVELDGRPVAAEFQLCGGGVTYAYQAGVDPDALEEEPGRLINVATLKKAIDDGQSGFDFLRGDEPYKAHWRAEPRPSIELHIAASSALARIRHGVWLAGYAMKHLIKSGLSRTGMHS